MFRPNVTLIYISRDRVVRADFPAGRPGLPASLVQRRRPESDDPATLISTVVSAGTSKLGKVFVLSTDFWTHTLDLAVATSAGMSEEELSQALGFEAEPLSGVSAFDSANAIVPAGSQGTEKRFWITAISAATREQFDEAIRDAGGRLAGLCHPGGLPIPLAPVRAGGAWKRVEVWPGAVVRMAFGETVPRMRIDDARAAGRVAVTAVATWRDETGLPGHDEFLAEENFTDEARNAGYTSLSLLDDAVLAEWLARWRQVLRASKPAVPLVRAPARALSPRRQATAMIGLAVLAVFACSGHYGCVQLQKSAIAAERARLKAPVDKLTELKKQTTTLQADAKKIRDESAKLAANVARCEGVFESQRLRMGILLEYLARETPEGWVLQRIEGTAESITLHGTALHPKFVGQFASRLAGELHRLGWSVEPPKQIAGNVLSDGAPWKFELTINDMVLESAPQAIVNAAAGSTTLELPKAEGGNKPGNLASENGQSEGALDPFIPDSKTEVR